MLGERTLERRLPVGAVVAAGLPWVVGAGLIVAGLVTSGVFVWVGAGLLSGLSLSGSI